MVVFRAKPRFPEVDFRRASRLYDPTTDDGRTNFAVCANPSAIGKHYATDRYLSRGEQSMPPLFPVARCWDCCHF